MSAVKRAPASTRVDEYLSHINNSKQLTLVINQPHLLLLLLLLYFSFLLSTLHLSQEVKTRFEREREARGNNSFLRILSFQERERENGKCL
jgi:hypothetical protein